MRHSFLASTVALVLAACGGPNAKNAQPLPNAHATDSPGSKNSSGLMLADSDDAKRDENGSVPIHRFDVVLGARAQASTLIVYARPTADDLKTMVSFVEKLRAEIKPDDLRIVIRTIPNDVTTTVIAQTAQAVYDVAGADAFMAFVKQVSKEPPPADEKALSTWLDAAAASAQADQAAVAKERASDRIAKKLAFDTVQAEKVEYSDGVSIFLNAVPLRPDAPIKALAQYMKEQRSHGDELAKEKGASAAYEELANAGLNEVKEAKNKSKEPEPNDTLAWYVPIGKSPVRGGKDALVTIVEFADMECPYCAKIEPTFEKIRAEFGDKVRFVWKNEPLPMHPRAVPAAMLAYEARAQKGEDGFWNAHDALLAQQDRLANEDLEAIAEKLGLNVKKVQAAVKTSKYEGIIDADVELAEEVNAAGTPHLFINGRRLVGNQPHEVIKKMVEEEIAHAESLEKKGVKPRAIYDHIMGQAIRPFAPPFVTIEVPEDAPRKGTGKVLVQEFADFECPYCARAKSMLDHLVRERGKEITLVWRHLPLPMHEQAQPASQAAIEVKKQKGDAGFWKYYAALFENQKEGLERATLLKHAKGLGVDEKALTKALDEKTHEKRVNEDLEAARTLDINGAPTFIVGGFLISGALPYRAFSKLVDFAIKNPHGVKEELTIVDLAEGSGAVAKSGDTVNVHYTGTLPDGSIFDSSRPPNETFSLKLGEGKVIAGWEKGLLGMKQGGKRVLTIPPSLGYGNKGSPPKIPGRMPLLFEIELVKLEAK